MFGALAIATICLLPPVNGPVIADYSPGSDYGGHWGVDYGAVLQEPVFAPVSGVVTFAGSVAGMRSVTIQPVVGFKVSVSYLSEIDVSAGDYVRRGLRIGRVGVEDGVSGVHLSTRIGGRYVDPATQMGCRSTEITRALRLVTPPQPYPRGRANRNPRRDLRSHPYRPPSRWGSCPLSGRLGQNSVHACGEPVAEVRERSLGR